MAVNGRARSLPCREWSGVGKDRHGQGQVQWEHLHRFRRAVRKQSVLMNLGVYF